MHRNGISAALAVCLFAGAAAAQEEQKRLLVMDMAHSDDTKADEARTITELVTARIDEVTKYRTVSGAEIRNLVALEGEKHALGCDDQSCLAEVAGAMGASFVVFGRLSKLGGTMILQMGLFDAEKAEAVGRETVKATSIDDIAVKLDGMVDKLVGVEGPTTAAPAKAEPADMGPVLGYGVAGVGGALLIGGVSLAGLSMATTADKTKPVSDRIGAQTGSWTGIALGAAGAAAVGGGLFLALAGGE
jgi:hypothetical protein